MIPQSWVIFGTWKAAETWALLWYSKTSPCGPVVTHLRARIVLRYPIIDFRSACIRDEGHYLAIRTSAVDLHAASERYAGVRVHAYKLRTEVSPYMRSIAGAFQHVPGGLHVSNMYVITERHGSCVPTPVLHTHSPPDSFRCRPPWYCTTRERSVPCVCKLESSHGGASEVQQQHVQQMLVFRGGNPVTEPRIN